MSSPAPTTTSSSTATSSTSSSSASSGTSSTSTTTAKAAKGKTIKAVTSFAPMTDADLSILGGAVVTGMTGNPDFPNPPVPITTLAADVTSYTNAIQAALDGGTNAKAVREKERKTVISDLKLLAIYVQDTSNGDMAVFTSSGFQAQTPAKTAGQPAAVPTIRTLDYGSSSGSLTLTLAKADNASAYFVRYAAMANGQPGAWTNVATVTAGKKITISGLTPGTTYGFQAQALGPTGYTDWSVIKTIMCV